jgi:hypothetical protein
MLFFTPAAAPVTVTLNWHCALGPIVAPVSEITPVALVVVSVPPHMAVGPESGTVSPAGSVSLKPTPVKATALVFAMVKVNEVVPLRGMVPAPKALVNVGADTCWTDLRYAIS